MRIAYIYDVVYPYVKGGAERRFWELAKRLSSRGHQVHIYGMKSWPGAAVFVQEGVYLHGIGCSRPLYTQQGIRSIRQVLSFTWRILPVLWRDKFDLVDCNAFPYLVFFPVKLYAFFKKVPLVVTWQEVWDKYWYAYLGYFKGHIARLVERAVIHLSHNIIVHCAKTMQGLLRCGVNPQRKNIRIIAHGVDFKLIDETPKSNQETDLIFMGRLIKDKNVDVLLKAVYEIKKELNDVKCTIIGDGPEKEHLLGLVRDLNLGENIIFKGLLEYAQALSFLKAAKIFILPSTREGFGIVVIEAMACGLSVITVDHPMNAATELIREEQNGFVAQLDAQDICKKALLLLKNENLRIKFCQAARSSVTECDWQEIADENERFYAEVINRRLKR